MFKRILLVSSLSIFLSLSAFAATVFVVDSTYKGHGERVCSIIREQAPNADVRLLSIANTPQISNYEVVRAIYDVIGRVRRDPKLREEGVVLNLSLGSPHYSASLAKAIRDAQAAGIVVVAAAGNGGPNQINYPAALPGVISVGALDAGYSGIGDVWAPAKYAGTSFAAPHVAGVIANRMDADRVGASAASRRILSDARSNNGVVGGIRSSNGVASNTRTRVNVVSPNNYRKPKQIIPDEEIFYRLFALLVLRSIWSDFIRSSSPYSSLDNTRAGIILPGRVNTGSRYPIIYNGRVGANPVRW